MPHRLKNGQLSPLGILDLAFIPSSYLRVREDYFRILNEKDNNSKRNREILDAFMPSTWLYASEVARLGVYALGTGLVKLIVS
ncbi:MAG: hypothetical protein Q8L27_02675 [archaeon]|nr:hypothetical protein [archaeon]